MLLTSKGLLIFEVDPELAGGFELNPTSFQKML
jgi:hypothetical protein